MTKSYRGKGEERKTALIADGVTYGLSLGRRAPMHRMHTDCIREIAAAGLTPVIFIGSANGADSPLFDPVRNPLTLEQQKEQLRLALPDLYDEKNVIVLQDRGNKEKWMQDFLASVEQAGLQGKSVFHLRSKAADEDKAGQVIKPLKEYAESFVAQGLPVWESFNANPADDLINASDIRLFDLEKLTAEQRGVMAAPDYIIELARRARENNPDKDLLTARGIPLTMLDLSLERLSNEAGMTTQQVISAAEEKGDVTVKTLIEAATKLVQGSRSTRQHFSKTAPAKKFAIKIASASCNQTAGDWPRNITNICSAIDKAVEDGADVLSLEELGLTGYERGDDFYYSDNKKTRDMLELIAAYAASKDPNLVISVGHPWYFADKSLPEQDERRKNPIFNRINNAFNVQTLITGGSIVSMSAKRYLFNYERGYEKRHFEEWSDVLAERYENKFGKGRNGTIRIELPSTEEHAARVIPFGSPVVQVGRGDKKINITKIICEEYWVGSRFDSSKDNSDYDRDSPVAQKSRQFDITVLINPNASPPVANKIDKHYELCKLASRYCQVIVHTDGLGTSGSTFAQFGSRLMAQDEKIISEGERISMKDVSYTSQIVMVSAPVYKGHEPHAVVEHTFKQDHKAPVQDGPAPWEKEPNRAFEEEMRDEALWMFDYMRKNKIPGVVEALSGGKDSVYNSYKIRLMVDLACHELGGVAGFMEALSYLPYKQKVLDVLHEKGEKAAIREIMSHMLTCVYMGTDNSSVETLRGAQTLIEGGTMEDGTPFEGIGGKFHYRNVQRLVEVYAEIFSGVNPGKLSPERDTEVRQEIAAILRLRSEETTPAELNRRVEELKSTFEEVTHDVLSVARAEHQLTYENIQARLREVLIMMFSNVENKLAVANPNLDEMCNSYATFGGDLHSGMVSGNAHKGKVRQVEHMQLLYDKGLHGIPPLKSMHYALKNRPSAELQPKDASGKVTQFDEDQLGRSFLQMSTIRYYMLSERPLEQNERKNNPTEVFEKCKKHVAFAGDDIETLHDRIRVTYERWGGNAQAKIHAGPIAMTYGENVDHQSSLRTPNISANHRPEQAQMALHCLAEMAKRDGSSFEKLTGGHSLRDLTQRALVDEAFNNALSSKMWTPEANDGRKMKIGTLYKHVCANGFSGLLVPTPMEKILAQASQWKKKSSPTPK